MQPLEAFVKEVREDILRFERYWVKHHKVEPERYPMRMNPGDWNEQFLAFLETEKPGR